MFIVHFLFNPVIHYSISSPIMVLIIITITKMMMMVMIIIIEGLDLGRVMRKGTGRHDT